MAWMSCRKDAQASTAGVADEALSTEQTGAAMDHLDIVLDTIGAFLREYGENAFDTATASAAEVREQCETWAKHLLLGAPHPNGKALKPWHPLPHRDWPGVRQFIAARRRDEGQFVAKSAEDLRESLWSFVQVLDNLICQDDAADERVQGEMERLKVAAQNSSLESIRHEVMSVVSQIARIAQERKEQQRAQMNGLHSQVRKLGEQLEVARLESEIDPLTHLYNRRALDSRLSQAASMCRLFRKPSCLLLIDLDHFKSINDRWGHLAGDSVLSAVSACMSRTFRVRNDFVARFGGEEFAVILSDTPLRRGLTAADRLQEAIRVLQIKHEETTITVTASIGISEATEEDTVQQWLERTDQALYEAKRGGRNRVVSKQPPGLQS